MLLYCMYLSLDRKSADFLPGYANIASSDVPLCPLGKGIHGTHCSILSWLSNTARNCFPI